VNDELIKEYDFHEGSEGKSHRLRTRLYEWGYGESDQTPKMHF